MKLLLYPSLDTSNFTVIVSLYYRISNFHFDLLVKIVLGCIKSDLLSGLTMKTQILAPAYQITSCIEQKPYYKFQDREIGILWRLTTMDSWCILLHQLLYYLSFNGSRIVLVES